MNKDDEEKMTNFLLFKIYATNKERDEMIPGLLIIIPILLLAIIALAAFLHGGH